MEIIHSYNKKVDEHNMLQQLLETTKKEKEYLQINLQTQNTNIENLNKNINDE
jgi:hypothetical protein